MPEITLTDISLKDYSLSPRVSRLTEVYFKAMPEICIERPRLVTRFTVDNDLLNQDRISILDKARTYRYVLENRRSVVRHRCAYDQQMRAFEFDDCSPFAGSTTSKFKGVPLYPELSALVLWPELWTIRERSSNPYHITDSEIKELNYEIFGHWIDDSVLELARKRCFEENWKKYGNQKFAPELKLFQYLVFFLVSKPNCISHTIPDFSRAVTLGLRQIINEAKDRTNRAAEDSKKQFYSAIGEALEGIVRYSRNLAAEAETLALRERDPALKEELLAIAEINRRVPEFSARTFREALTTVWICWTAIHLENPNVGLSLGRLDQVLYDLYRRDIDSGMIDINDAVELICFLWLKIGDHVPMIPEAGEQLFGGTGSNQAITIGGIDKDGNDAVNDLTYVMLRATELMKLRDPNLNARYSSGTNSPAYLRRLCEANVNTGATPAIHNDKAVIDALTQKQDHPEHARDYGVVGCVEPGSNGRTYGDSAAILLNLTTALELALFNGKHRHTGMDVLISKETGEPASFTRFDQFKTAFEEQSQWLIDQAVTLDNILARVHQDYYPTPILSALFEGPMEAGKDLIEGGAVINSSGATIIGLADVADCLSAIQSVVFEEKAISFSELLKALEKNFEGCQALQTRLMNPEKTPKYGNEAPMADANVAWIVEHLDKIFGEQRNSRGKHYRVGYWTMTNHAGYGKLMEAMPSGRKAHENFTSGITPVSGVTPCLTKALNSVAMLPAKHLSGGVALNLKYTPETADKEKMLDNFVASVEGYFDDNSSGRGGGMEIQFNVTTRETFLDARDHPEKYRELLVRVSGYTAYFKDLSPQMQQEIIDRTEYLLSTGTMVRFD
jgi:formate C-acetyltransferase